MHCLRGSVVSDDDLDPRTPIRLFEWRLRQVELEQERMSDKMETLATREDVRTLSAKIDKAAEKRDERSYNFWVTTLAGPIICGIVVGVVLFALLHGQGASATGR